MSVVFFIMSANPSVCIRAVMSGDLKWLSSGSEMPDNTHCEFDHDQPDSLGTEGVFQVQEDLLLAKMPESDTSALMEALAWCSDVGRPAVAVKRE